ncbi:MAG: hypothetical protein ABIZ95_18915 [Pyrinomonadaceae bacterium]
MKLLTVVFFVLTALTILHFVYEGIIAPSLRAYLRIRLFDLRDELRDLKIEREIQLPNDVFRDIQSLINGVILRLRQIDPQFMLLAEKAFENDAKLQQSAANKLARLEACPVDEVVEIRKKCFRYIDFAVLVNSGGLFFYLVPVVVCLLFFRNWKQIAKKTFVLPENEIDKIAPVRTFSYGSA